MSKDDWKSYQSFITNQIKEDHIIENYINLTNRTSAWIDEL